MADLGDLIPLAVEIRDANGVLANPTAIALTIVLPDGTAITPAPSNPTPGRYEYNYVPTVPGRYVARWVASGINSSAYVDTFDVRPADPGYLMSLPAAKAALNIDATDATYDEELRSLIEAVTLAVEDYRGETIVRRSVTETIRVGAMRFAASPGLGARRITVSRTPVISVTSIVRPYDGFAWSGTDAVLVDPSIGTIASYTSSFYGDLVVTYVAGYPVVPANYVEAGKVILRHLWQLQQTPGMGPSPFSGGGDVTPAIAGMGYAIPNRAAQLLGGRGPMIA